MAQNLEKIYERIKSFRGKQPVSITLDKGLVKRMLKLCDKNNISLSLLINEILCNEIMEDEK